MIKYLSFCSMPIGAVLFLTVLILAAPHADAQPTRAFALYDTGERTSDTRTIQIRGVGAGDFSPDHWTSGPPHLVPDIRHPLLEPQPGKFRNIYAPSAVARPQGGWYVYYGGWDGISEGRDAIYVTSTDNFTSFGVRQKVIVPGNFQHVCNVNAQFTYAAENDLAAEASDRGVTLMCTVYPDANGRNKPAIFHLASPAPPAPRTASAADIATIRGYENYSNADINGMNVLLRVGDRSLVYFGDFKNFGRINVAEGDVATTSTFELLGTALDARLAVNDVKILRDADNMPWYLMGLHMNRGELYYSLSDDATSFPAAIPLMRSAGDADKHIVAIGWVTDRDSPEGAGSVLGVLYGAGWSPTLDTNRIFARWIQKRLEFTSYGKEATAAVPKVMGALGPSTVVVSAPADSWSGSMSFFDVVGDNSIGKTSVTLEAGRVYEVR